MAAHENLSEYQFRYRPTGPHREGLEDRPYYNDWVDPDETTYDHEVVAIHKPTKEVAGSMLWNDNDGRIFQIHVVDEHQRKGVATGMLKHGSRVAEASRNRVHYPTRADIETEEGSAWSDAMEERGHFYY